MPKKSSTNNTGKAPTREDSKSKKGVKKLSKTGQSSRNVKDPSVTRGNRPRQGDVPDYSGDE